MGCSATTPPGRPAVIDSLLCTSEHFRLKPDVVHISDTVWQKPGHLGGHLMFYGPVYKNYSQTRDQVAAAADGLVLAK